MILVSPSSRATSRRSRGRQVGGECLLQIDLAAASAKAWDALTLDSFYDAVARPPMGEKFRPHKSIIFIVGMLYMLRRNGNAQAWQGGELVCQRASVLTANGQPTRKLAESYPSNR